MNQIRFPALVLFFMASATFLLACAGPAAPAVQPTALSTLVPPTTAPTAAQATVPPTTAPTATTAATNTPASDSAPADKVVADAFEGFFRAERFHLQARAELSPIFFQGEYTPLPGEDPDLVSIFEIEGDQSQADMQYGLSGFLASFIGLFSGFDPNINEIGIAEVDGTRYMFGNLENETESKWYILPEEPGSTSSFTPQEMLLPMSAAEYPEGSFSKSGTTTIGSLTCDVFTGSRDAFDAVFPDLVSATLLNTETLDLESMDRTEYSVTVCPDGDLARVEYNFDAHSKTNPDDKGTFAFQAELSNLDGDITIVPPPDAIPLPSVADLQPTTEPDATPRITPHFTTVNGEWEGLSGDDSPLSFTVEDGGITYVNINYAVSSGGCSTSGVIANSVDNGKIQDSTFSVVLTDSDNVQYTVQGKFESNNKAAGTLAVQGKTFCGDTDSKFDWTAQHISSPAVEETPKATTQPTQTSTPLPTQIPTTLPTQTPTVQPTQMPPQPTRTPTVDSNGAKIIADAFAAFAARDLNLALANVSDNVVFNIGGTTGVGKSALQSNMQLALTFGANFSVTEIRQVGNIVTFTTTVTGIRAGTYTNSSAIIENGKITVFNIN